MTFSNIKPWTFVLCVLGIAFLAACASPSGGTPDEDGETPGGGEPVAVTLNADAIQGEVPFIVSFNASAKGTGADTRYTWDFGEGASEGGLSRLHVFSEPGSYTVRVLAKGEAGGKFAELQLEALESTIPRNISNIPPTVDLVATVIDPEKSNTVSFLASGQDTPDETLSYVLDFGDGNRTTQASAEHTYAAPGFYLATVVVRDTHNTVALAQAEVVVRED